MNMSEKSRGTNPDPVINGQSYLSERRTSIFSGLNFGFINSCDDWIQVSEKDQVLLESLITKKLRVDDPIPTTSSHLADKEVVIEECVTVCDDQVESDAQSHVSDKKDSNLPFADISKFDEESFLLNQLSFDARTKVLRKKGTFFPTYYKTRIPVPPGITRPKRVRKNLGRQKTRQTLTERTFPWTSVWPSSTVKKVIDNFFEEVIAYGDMLMGYEYVYCQCAQDMPDGTSECFCNSSVIESEEITCLKKLIEKIELETLEKVFNVPRSFLLGRTCRFTELKHTRAWYFDSSEYSHPFNVRIVNALGAAPNQMISIPKYEDDTLFKPLKAMTLDIRNYGTRKAVRVRKTIIDKQEVATKLRCDRLPTFYCSGE